MSLQGFIEATQARARDEGALPFSHETVEALGLGLYESDDPEPLRELEEGEDPTVQTMRMDVPGLQGRFVVIPMRDTVQLVNLDPEALAIHSERHYPRKAPRLVPESALESGTCILTDDPLDALALIDAGANAIYADSEGLRRLIDLIRGVPKAPMTMILPGYSDPENPEASEDHTMIAEETERAFHDAGLPASVYHFHPEETYHGAYRMMADDGLRDLIDEIEDDADAGRSEALSRYEGTSAGARVGTMLGRILKAPVSPVPTGFPRLDEVLDGGIYPGLYVIGANSSLGKTTLALQIADNLALTSDVLFFTVEQSEEEMMAKSLSRISYREATALETPLTAREILSRGTPLEGMRLDLLERCARTYRGRAGRLYYVADDRSRLSPEELDDGSPTIPDTRVGMDTVRNCVAQHITLTGRKPIVVIDYLQILRPESTLKGGTDKQNIDLMVSELRRMTRDRGIPVIVISSKNRASYTGASDMGGFKESGMIEYSADVILELAPEGMKNSDTPLQKSTDVKTLKDTRAKEDRNMVLAVSKNRMGRTDRGIPLMYHARYNVFEETPKAEDDGTVWLRRSSGEGFLNSGQLGLSDSENPSPHRGRPSRDPELRRFPRGLRTLRNPWRPSDGKRSRRSPRRTSRSSVGSSGIRHSLELRTHRHGLKRNRRDVGMTDLQRLRNEMETRPNLPIILRGLYYGVEPGILMAMMPDPEALGEDLRLLEELGMIERRPEARRGACSLMNPMNRV